MRTITIVKLKFIDGTEETYKTKNVIKPVSNVVSFTTADGKGVIISLETLKVLETEIIPVK